MCSVLTSVSMWAYTTADLTAAGWSEVTAISNDANNDNYVGKFVYVFVDAGSSSFVLSGETVKHPWNDTYRPSYRTIGNPFTNKYEVWTLEVRSDGFAMCNVETKDYYNSTNSNGGDGCWNKMATNDYTYGSFTFTLSNGKYSISGVSSQSQYGNEVGPWDGTVYDSEGTAANKSGDAAPGFYIYRMAKATYARKYLQQTPNLTAPVDVSYLIVNPTIYQGGYATELPWGWHNWEDHETDNNKYTESTGNTKLLAWARTSSGNPKTLDFDYYQQVSDLPGGKYNISSYVYATQHISIYLYFSDSNKNISNQKNVRITTEDKDIVDGSNTTFGVKADERETTRDHTLDLYADDFQMQIDPYISSMATDLPANGAMTAGLWYHFTVTNSYKYALSSTNLNNIIYVTGSTTTLSAVGSDKFSAAQNLTAGTDYYVRSTTDNTLTIKPCISSVAAALPANGAMTADEWYYFDIATAGHYDVVATSLSNIVYTTNGDLAQDAIVENHFTVKNNDLSATRYYVKSSSAQTLRWYLTDDKDYTSYIKNPSFDDAISDANWTLTSGAVDYWSVFERVETGGVEEYNRPTIRCEQTINNLPSGVYKVTVQGYYRGGGGGYAEEARNAKLFANDEEVDLMSINDYKAITTNPGVENATWSYIDNSFYVPDNTVAANYVINTMKQYNNEITVAVSNGTLTIGVKKDAAVGSDWTYFDNFTLTYTGPYNEVVESGETQTYEGTFTENIELEPTAEYPIVDISGASFTGTLTADFDSNDNGFIIATAAQKAALGDVKNVVVGNTCENLVITDGTAVTIPADLETATSATYSRNIAATSNFGTICLPYDVESDDDIQYYTASSISDGVLTLETVDEVPAGTPAIFKKKNAEATSITAASSNTSVTPDAGEAGSAVVLVGTFEEIRVDGTDTPDAEDCYYISNNQFWQGNEYFFIGAFRAYLTGGAGARLTIQVDEEETAINTLEELNDKKELKDGKYLINGRIVVVKDGNSFSIDGVLE